MAFPQVVNEISSANNTDQTDQVVTLPGSLVNGNKLVAALAIDGVVTVTWPAGWDEILDANRTGVSISVGVRTIDGSEGGTVTVTASATERSSHHCWQIAGHDNAILPEALSADGNSGTPNPPDLAPTGGAKDYLWLALAALQPGTNTASGFPSSYGNTGQESGDASLTQCPIAWARRELNAASENPGTFSVTSSNWMAATVAIHPGAAAAANARLIGSNLLRSNLLGRSIQ